MTRDEAYEEAEQRIEAARLEEATELDLSRMGLTELPEASTKKASLSAMPIFWEPAIPMNL